MNIFLNLLLDMLVPTTREKNASAVLLRSVVTERLALYKTETDVKVTESDIKLTIN
jgi:hypothetical protein